MLMKAENFHNKKWFEEDEAAHGYDGRLDIEPHDPVSRLKERVRMAC
jgi:hypothetical protein